jgi:transposase InsO family protein
MAEKRGGSRNYPRAVEKRLPTRFSSSLKNELIHHQTYQSRDDASREIFAFIEGFYNRQRLHQSLGYLSPLEFEMKAELA